MTTSATISLVCTLFFAVLNALYLWHSLRRSPRERCKRLLVKITAHPSYRPLDTSVLVGAVQDEDEAYLKAYRKAYRKALGQS
jgi:hypothetical protein